MNRTSRLLCTLLGLVLLALPATAFASHFRGGTITWTRANTSTRTVNYIINHSWRVNAVNSVRLFYGDGGSSGNLSYTVLGTFTDATGLQYTSVRSTTSRTFSSNGPFTGYFSSCCRIGNLQNGANGSFRVETVVNLNGGNTASPAVGAPALAQMVGGAQNSLAMSIVDPDNNSSATCGWSSSSQAGTGGLPPSWLSINPTTCVLSGTPPGGASRLYAYSVRVTDNNGAVTTFDGMIETITGSPPTCSGGGNFNVTVGQPFSTQFTGTNPTGGTVSLQVINGPPGGSLSPTSGTSPRTSTFSWTPPQSAFGQTYAANVIVTNSQNLQASCPLGLTVPLNSPPNAEANGPYSATKGVGVSVSAAGSFDSDGSITNYAWDCDLNGSYEVSTTSVNATCAAFTLGGSYTIRLRVTDDQGSTDTDTATVNVANVGPNAEAGGPYTGGQGSPIVISGAASTDGDGGTLSYAWDCNTANGTTYVTGSATTSCTYPDDQTYSGSLRVCDPEGACDTDSFTVNVTNAPPTANAGGPYTAGQGVSSPVSGAGSSDPDGTISTYEWDCDASDGINYVSSGSSSSFSCTWPDDGPYVVTLRVTDDDGATDVDTAAVTVTNTPPNANAGGVYTGQKNSQITVTGAASNDPDGTIVLYQWDCDASDGVNLSAGSSSPIASCTYSTIGTYTVTLKVTDDDGATDTATGTVSIANAAPNANAGGPYSVFQGSVLTLDGSGSTDPDGFLVSYEWDCDSSNGVTYSAPSASSVFTCVYSSQGTYTATLRVTDDDGATDVGSATVIVTNQPPIAEAGGPYNGNQSAAMPVFGFGSTDADGSVVLYEWDCTSDGSFDTSSSSPTGSTCTYPTIGVYTITLRVTDDDGASATDTATATIGNQPPVAAPGGPYAALQGATVTINGSSSADTDGTLVDFSWDCDAGNGVSLISSGTNSSFACTYPAVGTFTVTLTVTDDDGATDTETTQVIVGNGAPVAVAGGPYSGVKNVPIAVDGSSSADADGTIVLYEWDCDSDGTVDVSATTPGAACVYGGIGTFTITLTVTDDDGGTSSDTATVNIPPVNPVANAGGPYAGTQNVPIALDASGSSDSDGNIATYEWDCQGDGIYEFISFNPNDVTCTYSVVGTYTVQLQVTDDDGLQDVDTAVVSLANVLPVADAGGPYNGTEASPIVVSGAGSGDADGVVVQYSWDCNSDGLPDAILPTPSGATCTYPASGVYTITLTVTDDDGATDSDTATVTVLSSPPVASAGGPYTGNEGSLVLLNGSGSSDAGGSIVQYQWDCTSDGTYEFTSSQPLGNGCSYVDEGTYTVTIRVTDDDGDSATSSATVTVANVAPTLVGPAGPTTGNEGQSMNWTATATDPGVLDVLSYSWDFGDGVSATGPTATHTYLQDGSYNLTVTVTDGDGGSDTNTVVVVIGNLPPTLTVWTIPIASDEGQLLNFTAEATDPGVLDVLTFSWDFGDGSVGETGDVVNYAFADDGTYTITLTVTDDGGLSDTVTSVINVANVDPTITSMTGDLTGMEAEVLSWSATATDPGVLDVLVYTWDFGDGTVLTGATVSHAYVNEGTYVITLTVTDGDGGIDIETLSVDVLNAPPNVDSLTAPGGDEGAPITYSVVASDVGVLDTLSYLWDFGDGTFATGATATKIFDDDGTYAVSVTITDDGGEFTTTTTDVLIDNVAPVILTMVSLPDANPDEGSSIDLEATATDQGAADIPDLIYTWDFGDGTPGAVGDDTEHIYPDDGVFVVTLTVDDQDGGVTVQTLTITVANVDPIITSNPPVNATQGALYSYAPQVVDPGDEVFTWTLSPGAPAAMTIDPSTGLIQWTPTYADYLIGQHTVVLTVDDGDGGIDQQSWTITVFDTDTDGDGIPDDWEITNGLDPLDPTDAGDDPDGDGITNLGEFGFDQDPFSFDGPTAPTPISPIDGEEIVEVSPDLVVDNATDPQNDTLVYDFELYEDEAMTILVTSVYGVAEDASGQTSWKVDVQLTEDQEYWWQARANDPFVAGPWTELENFVLNQYNDGPPAPELVYPIDGEIVTVLQPTLEWTQVEDPNGDEVTYDIVVYAEDGVTMVAEAFGIVDSGNPTSTWMLDVALTDDSGYWWTARAVDDEGLPGDWAEAEDFFLTTENGAPDAPVFIDPLDGDQIVEISPRLLATEVTDPEGGDVVYQFEIDQVGTFDSIDYRTATVPETFTGSVWWDLADAGIALDENAWAFARVRAIDEEGIASAPDTITFFVRGPNDAPDMLTLISPADGSTVPGLGVVMVLGNVDDVENDLVFYDFLLARDPEMTEVVFSSDGVAEGSGPDEGEDTTSVLVPVTLLGEYYWTARAVDELGEASDWAVPFRFVATGDQDTGPVVDPDSFVGGSGCKGCASSMSATERPTTLWLLALLPGALLVRRRRR